MKGQAQSSGSEPPPILMVRAEESYLFLRKNDSVRLFLKPLKYIPLNQKGSVYLSLGGEYRPRLEHFTNENYTSKDRTYYSQRISFHANVALGARIRAFGEVFHGYTSVEELFLNDDPIDLHQGFLEFIPIKNSSATFQIRLGRQEMGLGSARLVGIREGPNMRRSFDMGRLMLTIGQSSLNAFYGKEVATRFGAFDNRSYLFSPDSLSPTLFGLYYQRPLWKNVGKLDLYYLGFYSPISRYDDAAGEEMRHSLGLRSYGKKGPLSYNTEFIFQFGRMGSSEIRAFNLETDWTYQFTGAKWKPSPGIRLDWSSGDPVSGDGRLGTFNPLFVNPAIYSLAAVNTPANIISLHPNLTLYPTRNLSIYLDYALFYRTQLTDGLYTPPRFLARSGANQTERHIGDVVGLQISYEIIGNLSFILMSSYFIAGSFLEASGDSENTFYVSPTLSCKF